MDKFVIRSKSSIQSAESSTPSTNEIPNPSHNVDVIAVEQNFSGDDRRSEKRARLDKQSVIISDPALRKPINEHDPLITSLKVARFLLSQGMVFQGHDERISSKNRCNFMELLKLCGDPNKEVAKVVLGNVPANHQLTSHSAHKDIAKVCASKTINAIVRELRDKFFSILIDEFRDVTVKDHMAIFFRYLNDQGVVVERFLGVVHVRETTILCLKSGIDGFFAEYGLSFSKLRGQGYNGASNMRDEHNGLKTLILKENPYARYINCFGHPLQLVILGCANKNFHVADFFSYLILITNTVGASCKISKEFRQIQHDNMVEMFKKGEISNERGLHQESSLTRSGTTHWGSHYTTIFRLLMMWKSTTKVLENLVDDGGDSTIQGNAASLGEKIESYQFVFIAHLMKLVLGWANILSQLLQQRDQNIIAAMTQVHIVKEKFQDLRENGWDDLIQEVNEFCATNNVVILKMEDYVSSRFRSRQAGEEVKMTNYHHFRANIFCQVIDHIIQEMENHFNETSTTLLTCSASLNPKNSFSNYSRSKLLQLAELYPKDFSDIDRYVLKQELEVWIASMRGNEMYSTLEDLESSY